MAKTSVTKGRIGLLNGSADEDLRFQYNPTQVRRNRRSTYANNNASLADFPNTSTSQQPPIEWIRNEAEDISIDLIFHEDHDDVEEQLQKLDDLMAPDPNTGQPRDLLFVMGVRTDRVRILEKDVVEKLFDHDLNVQEATVSLRLKSLTSRSGGGR